MKYPLLTSLFLLWTSASCQSPQEKQGSTDEKLFREYCLMNATETYDFALPGSLTVEDLQRYPRENRQSGKRRQTDIKNQGQLLRRLRTGRNQTDKQLGRDCSHIAIIATYDNLRMLKIAVEKYGIKVPVYHLTNGVGQELFSRNDKKGIPTCSLYATKRCNANPPFPLKLFPDFSASYYETMTGYLAREDKKHTLFTFTNKDLGTVERGKTYEVEFDYRNTKDSLLVIHDVRHSCDCVVPQWKNAPLRKGEWKTGPYVSRPRGMATACSLSWYTTTNPATLHGSP